MESKHTPPVAMANIFTKWHYEEHGKRDLRVDFIRGFVMLILVAVHVDMLSIYSYISWERIGVVTGAEGFVMLSGVILGILSRMRMEHDGFAPTVEKQFGRAFLLYRTSLVVIFSVLAINVFIDAHAVMTFTTYGGKVFNLYPDISKFAEFHNVIMAKFLMLRYGPHQFQILGLYVILLFVSPFVLWLLSKKKAKVILSLSWILYFYNNGYHTILTGAQFEYAFPVLTWQILFVHGLTIGYYRDEIWNFFHSRFGIYFFRLILVLFFFFLFLTYNNPIPMFPDYMKLHFIKPDTFHYLHSHFFDKNTLGIGRLANDFVMLTVSYAMLSYFWKPLNRTLGWFFIPIGQASLYVFILHVYVCLVMFNIPLFGGHENILINTVGHTLAFAFLWLMVKYQVAYSIIPR